MSGVAKPALASNGPRSDSTSHGSLTAAYVTSK
jgi:hypothetical protein